MSDLQPEYRGGSARVKRPGMTVDAVIRAFTSATGVLLEDLCGPSKTSEITRARHELMYALRQLTPASFELIGRYLGGRDMATVHAGVANIERAADLSQEYAERIDLLVEALAALRPLVVPQAGLPWPLVASLSILRNATITDAEARQIVLGFLEQIEVPHGR